MNCRLVGLSMAMVLAGGCVAASDTDGESTSLAEVTETGQDPDQPDEDQSEPDDVGEHDERDEPATTEEPDEGADEEVEVEVVDLDARRAAFTCPAPSDELLLSSQTSASPGAFEAAREILELRFAGPVEVGPSGIFEEPVESVLVEELVDYYQQNGPDTFDTSFALANEQGTSGPPDAVLIRSLYQSAPDVPAAVEFRSARPSVDSDLERVNVSNQVIEAAGELGWLIHNAPSIGVADAGELLNDDGTVTEFAYSAALEVWWGCSKLVVQVYGPGEGLVTAAVSAEMQDWVSAVAAGAG